MTFTSDDLRPLEILEGLPEETLYWLSEHGTKIELAVGDHLFTPGQTADYMFIVVEGRIQRYEEVGGQRLLVSTTPRGKVTGMLPFSRMTHYPGLTLAVEPSQILRIDKSNFNELLSVSHELGQRLVAEMSNRVRGDVRLEQQRDKMMALGRLSAGLAHELNNPAAAIRRTSGNLADRLAGQSALITALVRHDLQEGTVAAIEQLRQEARDREPTDNLPTLTLSDREEKLTVWLEARMIEDARELAEIFVETGLQTEDLERFSESVPQNVLKDALTWVAGSIDAARMIKEIIASSSRVSELVASVKTYSHMDRSSEHKPTDVREGLDNTLTMLGHKLKQKTIQLNRDYPNELPSIPAHGGELNQVWTNLIDNALDAMDESGELGIKVESDDWGVIVRITDNGSGIPDDVVSRIFDPFFTTKDVGAGTGLGLDIARRIVHTHGGQIEVNRKPGITEMCVRMPLAPG